MKTGTLSRARTSKARTRRNLEQAICPICRARQVARPDTGRPRKTCSSSCAAEFRRLRQFTGRCLGRVRETLLSAAQDIEGFPLELREKFGELERDLADTSAAELLEQRLAEGWVAGRLKLE